MTGRAGPLLLKLSCELLTQSCYREKQNGHPRRLTEKYPYFLTLASSYFLDPLYAHMHLTPVLTKFEGIMIGGNYGPVGNMET